jgi:hypothetical protein
VDGAVTKARQRRHSGGTAARQRSGGGKVAAWRRHARWRQGGAVVRAIRRGREGVAATRRQRRGRRRRGLQRTGEWVSSTASCPPAPCHASAPSPQPQPLLPLLPGRLLCGAASRSSTCRACPRVGHPRLLEGLAPRSAREHARHCLVDLPRHHRRTKSAGTCVGAIVVHPIKVACMGKRWHAGGLLWPARAAGVVVEATHNRRPCVPTPN